MPNEGPIVPDDFSRRLPHMFLLPLAVHYVRVPLSLFPNLAQSGFSENTIFLNSLGVVIVFGSMWGWLSYMVKQCE